jgi:4-hydroxy-tetrahydrodipicolinate synthase
MLKGSIVAIVTPFNEDGSINYNEFGNLIEYHIENKTDGIVVLGTTGEASTIGYDEQEEIIKFAVEKANKRIPIIVGAGTNYTHKSVELAKKYSNLGVDYLLVITPYYNKCNDSGLYKHFTMIADNSKCPIILYNVPGRTGMSINISVLEKLAKHPNIYGIKEASGNMEYSLKVSKLLSDDFIMYSGNDDIIVDMMKIGAKGVISVLSNIAPMQVHNMCEYALNNDFIKAYKIQKELLDVADKLFIEVNPIPVKEAMNYLGFKVGGYHLPLDYMNEDNKKVLINTIDNNKEVIF